MSILKTIQGDITAIQRGVILHGVNCQNVMGAGLAKKIAEKWPSVKQAYHDMKPKRLGDIQFVVVHRELIVVNCFTQLDYMRSHPQIWNCRDCAGPFASIAAISHCVHQALHFLPDDAKVFTPRIGCGLGGLDWDRDVKPIFEMAVRDIPVDLTVVEMP
jgi:O-acetyl-ADP-ribose deacetylase (regulator of RNase III)